ncbi:MAG: TatD family hydrolase [Verrucomicrobiales bacterium]|nr:TatD family hydrolase [Verrucomicrobiales bacterium]
MKNPGPFAVSDAHNHLQDDRFGGCQEERVAEAARAGVRHMVVNGSAESDWPAVAELAQRFPSVIPAFGYHPWHLGERTPDWESSLSDWLDSTPGAVVGEIGLDRWMLGNPDRWRSYSGLADRDPPPMELQEALFLVQMRMAVRRQVAASIHCLQAFGRLRDLLAAAPRPSRGFLLHSYGGPAEMVPEFVRLGAYFGFPGYYGHERKARQRETFRCIPVDRILLETDAPDQCLPAAWNRHPLTDARTGAALNHPANLGAVCEILAGVLKMNPAELADATSANFDRLFGRHP